MKLVRQALAVCLAVMFMAPAAHGQSNVVSTSALDKAVQERVSQDAADRDAIRSLLQRAEVRAVADKAGLSLDKALRAVSTLSGDDLRQLAEQSRQIDNELAGGASTVVISTTTIIIVLLLVILIVALAD